MIRARSSKPPPQPIAPPAQEIPRSRYPSRNFGSPLTTATQTSALANRRHVALPRCVPSKLPATATTAARGNAAGNQSACSHASRDPAPPTAALATPLRPLQSPKSREIAGPPRNTPPADKLDTRVRQRKFTPQSAARAASSRATSSAALPARAAQEISPLPSFPNCKSARPRLRSPRANPPEFPSARAPPFRPASILPRTAYRSVARPHPQR